MAEILTFLALAFFTFSLVVWLPVVTSLVGKHD